MDVIYVNIKTLAEGIECEGYISGQWIPKQKTISKRTRLVFSLQKSHNKISLPSKN
jgi:hypothetical protein